VIGFVGADSRGVPRRVISGVGNSFVANHVRRATRAGAGRNAGRAMASPCHTVPSQPEKQGDLTMPAARLAAGSGVRVLPPPLLIVAATATTAFAANNTIAVPGLPQLKRLARSRNPRNRSRFFNSLFTHRMGGPDPLRRMSGRTEGGAKERGHPSTRSLTRESLILAAPGFRVRIFPIPP
jgi:hypothetical protein